MDIWKFNCGGNNFAPFLYAHKQDIEAMLFVADGNPKEWPTPPQCRPYIDPDKKKQLPLADLSYISPGTILLNSKAYNALSEFLTPFGQLLEVECLNDGGIFGDKASEPFYFYNVTTIIPCIDYEQSEKRGKRITKESYFPDRIPTDVQIFRDPQRIRVQIYLSTPAKEAFEKLIASAKLTGAEFTK